MYSKDGEDYFIVDSHVHIWDGRKENQKNVHGQEFLDCFYAYHSNLSPDSEKWTHEEFEYYGGERFLKDIFEDGYVDHAIFNGQGMNEFYHNGFTRIEECWELTQKHPEKLIMNGSFDPRNGKKGLEQFRRDAERFDLQGVKLYTAEWNGDSRGYKLSDPNCREYLEACLEMGINKIHVHKGPTLKPLDKDAFNVDDVDAVASDYLDLTFIVEHCGLPRLEDFCWIATQESNVLAGLSVVMPFMHTRPRYFAQVIGELLYWVGEDKMTFSSDYALWTPKWLVENFVDFQMPEDLTDYAPITTAQKKKILGLNAAALYDIEVPEHLRLPTTADEGHLEVAPGAKEAVAS